MQKVKIKNDLPPTIQSLNDQILIEQLKNQIKYLETENKWLREKLSNVRSFFKSTNN